ncbi:hypothetical protein PRIPAC_92754 [Pristionchus pacificus]|uniref:CX domain-containing protein n=1 Tax=Pristionchus pacificus TaxID=54126 RepID=A0A2A6CDN8_PRIPA|nr:hypothetical protein PRIPAC_92754 [Pristionchus pacificus]|eukprot:PDM76153.1 hypothetical protein PRIPAC_39757 [Pristionchus pacificus]
MLCRCSLRWALLLVLLIVLLGQLSEGKGGRSGGGRGGGRSGGSSSRRSSGATSSSRSSSYSSKSSGKSWFGGSKSSKGSSSGSTWFTKTKSPTSRTGGGFKSIGSSHAWSTSHPRPSVTSASVSHGLFAPSHTVYLGSGSGCGFGGCGPSYTVYHYYSRTHYYSSMRTTTTTPSPISPKSDQVSSALINNDTLIYTDGIEATNETQVAEIADPARPIVIQDLAFFWDSKYLPSENLQGCATYTPANANSTISFCDVKEYSRCQRNLKEVPNFQDVFFPDKTAPSHLAWLCPASTGCCDWECCSEGEAWSVGEIFWWSIIGFFGLFLLTKCCCSVWATYKQEEAEHRRKCEELEKLTAARIA